MRSVPSSWLLGTDGDTPMHQPEPVFVHVLPNWTIGGYERRLKRH
jgi:hypothetical protein